MGWAPVAFALLHLLLTLALLSPAPDTGGDNAAYLALGRSLVEGGGYRDLWDPAAPVHTQYPPVWPALIGAALAIGAGSWTALKVLAALFSAGAVALSYLWARRTAGSGVATLVGLVLAMGPGVVGVARVELSDAPFWAFAMLALWALSAERPPGDPERSPGAPTSTVAMAAGAAAVLLAYGTRSAGLPLVLAAIAWLGWSRRWRTAAAIAVPCGVLALAGALRTAAAGGGGYAGYLRFVDPYRPEAGTIDLAGLLARVAENAVRYGGEHLPFLLVGATPQPFAAALGAGLTLLAAAGWARRLRRRDPGLAGIWLPLYLGLVLVWPWTWSAPRLILPVLPVLLVLAAEAAGAAAARARLPRRATRFAAAAALLLMLPPALLALLSERTRLVACRETGEPLACIEPGAADFLLLAGEVRGRLPAGSAVIARKPTLWWAESGYPSRVFPYAADPDTLLAAAREAGARYVVVDRWDDVATLHLMPAIIQRPQGFCVMTSRGSEHATLLGIVPGAETMPNLRERPGDEEVEQGFARCGPEYWARGEAQTGP